MNWYQSFIMQYLRGMEVTIEFKGVTEEGLREALYNEAMRKLREIEGIIYEEEMSAEEKVEYLITIVTS